MASKILVVEDSSAIRAHIRSVLERDGSFDEILEAGDGLAGFKLLVEQRPDLVLCDLVMPGFDGTRFLMMHGARADVREIPVVMLTAESDLGRKVEILEKGASDYVTKPFHEKELLARVRIHVRLKVLQDELKAANARLEQLAVTDPLTGLANRRRLDERIVEEVERARRYATPLSVVMVDIDHFKDVNDRFGHAMGDTVLRNLGQLVVGSMRATDCAARYGGEEIVLVLPHTGEEGACGLSERLRVSFAATVHRHDESVAQKTASFGVASFAAARDQRVRADALLERADAAMYEAKRTGRNRVVTWSDAITTPADP